MRRGLGQTEGKEEIKLKKLGEKEKEKEKDSSSSSSSSSSNSSNGGNRDGGSCGSMVVMLVVVIHSYVDAVLVTRVVQDTSRKRSCASVTYTSYQDSCTSSRDCGHASLYAATFAIYLLFKANENERVRETEDLKANA
ncbi:hypothetical protein M0802_005010 [Mischocyttarus mexicanus]|nr:hypothetical protein M0802_005010 [Mischocyttarus mexicanus]